MHNKNERILSFGRRKGRALGISQQELMGNLLPKLIINDDNPLKFPPQINKFIMEIGFGNGDHLAVQVQNNPNIGFIGCEPYMNGVAHLLTLLDETNDNIRLWPEDARILLDQLPDQFLAKVYILFPDPWPKIKHHKRRIISNEMLKLLAKKLNDQGEVMMATDHSEYAQWILKHFMDSEDFIWTANSPKDWQQPPQGWVRTRYQKKAEELSIKPYFLNFKKSIAY
jgi:tRNA (guanine-N7-)-methyltransferase